MDLTCFFTEDVITIQNVRSGVFGPDTILHVAFETVGHSSSMSMVLKGTAYWAMTKEMIERGYSFMTKVGRQPIIDNAKA